MSAAIGAALLAFSAAPAACAADLPGHSDALWRVVHDLCTPDQRFIGLPAPCLAVDLKAGYAVVPNPKLRSEVLVTPTARVTGIEDAALLRPDAPDYWRFAWGERGRLISRVGAAAAQSNLGLAVNAVDGRSQDQLHIHLSCARRDVAARLDALHLQRADGWSTQRIDGQPWRVRRVQEPDLATAPLMASLSGDAAFEDLGRETVVVIGPSLGDDGPLYLLHHSASGLRPDDRGHGEALLDESCRTAAP